MMPDTWYRIEVQKLPASKRVRNIGVSNFGIKHLEAIAAHPEYKIVPAVNQIEVRRLGMRNRRFY
jgi:diketogulonate reductase-like aldo/keto reductase